MKGPATRSTPAPRAPRPPVRPARRGVEPRRPRRMAVGRAPPPPESLSADERRGLSWWRLSAASAPKTTMCAPPPQRRPPPAHRLLHLPSSPLLITATQHRELPACFTQSHSATWAGPRPDAPDSSPRPPTPNRATTAPGVALARSPSPKRRGSSSRLSLGVARRCRRAAARRAWRCPSR